MDENSDLYREIILDHFQNPRNKGVLNEEGVARASASNISCGDDLMLDVIWEDGVIKKLNWRGNGCAISQSTMSILSEWLLGKSREEISTLTKQDMLSMVGLAQIAPTREKCLLLCLRVMKKI